MDCRKGQKVNDPISFQSVEYLLLPVIATKNGATYAPTGDTVEAAVVPSGDAVSDSDFVAASWEPNTTSVRVLVGPGTTVGTLAVGFYDVYSRIYDNPETPVLLHGTVQVV